MTSNLLFLFPDIPLAAKAIRTNRGGLDAYNKIGDFYPWENTKAGPKHSMHRRGSYLDNDLRVEHDLGASMTKAVNFLALARADGYAQDLVASITLKGHSQSIEQLKDVGRRRGTMYHWDADTLVSNDTTTGVIDSWKDRINTADLTPSGTKPLLTRCDSRANFLLRSNDFTWAPKWTLSNATRPTTTLYPDAILLTEAATTSTHTIAQNVNYLQKGMRYRCSVYAKASGRSIRIILSGNCFNYGTSPQAYFNLGTGAVGSTSGGGAPSATITAIGGGVYRCTMEATANITADNSATITYALDNDAGTNYTGNGTSGAYLYHPQLQRDVDDQVYLGSTSFPQISGVNGKRALYFHNNGGAGCPIVASTTSIADYTTEFSIYSVIQSEVVTGADYEIYRKGGGGTGDGFREYIRSADLKRVFQDTSGSVVSTNAVTSGSIDECFVDRGAGSGTVTLRKNQSADGSGALAAPTSGAAGLQIGGTSTAPFRGKIASLIIVNKELSSQDGSIIGLYLLEAYRDTTATYVLADLPTTLAAANLVGSPFTNDYFVTFTALASFRFWDITFGREVSGQPLGIVSKCFFGSYLDLGVDGWIRDIHREFSRAATFTSSVGSNLGQKGKVLGYSGNILFEGVSDTNLKDFLNRFAVYGQDLNFFLATMSDHSQLENKRLIYCKMNSYSASQADNYQNYNNLEIDFNEVL